MFRLRSCHLTLFMHDLVEEFSSINRDLCDITCQNNVVYTYQNDDHTVRCDFQPYPFDKAENSIRAKLNDRTGVFKLNFSPNHFDICITPKFTGILSILNLKFVSIGDGNIPSIEIKQRAELLNNLSVGGRFDFPIESIYPNVYLSAIYQNKYFKAKLGPILEIADPNVYKPGYTAHITSSYGPFYFQFKRKYGAVSGLSSYGVIKFKTNNYEWGFGNDFVKNQSTMHSNLSLYGVRLGFSILFNQFQPQNYVVGTKIPINKQLSVSIMGTSKNLIAVQANAKINDTISSQFALSYDQIEMFKLRAEIHLNEKTPEKISYDQVKHTLL